MLSHVSKFVTFGAALMTRNLVEFHGLPPFPVERPTLTTRESHEPIVDGIKSETDGDIGAVAASTAFTTLLLNAHLEQSTENGHAALRMLPFNAILSPTLTTPLNKERLAPSLAHRQLDVSTPSNKKRSTQGVLVVVVPARSVAESNLIRTLDPSLEN